MASKVKRDPLSRYFKDLDEFEISSGEESDGEAEQSAGKTPVTQSVSESIAGKSSNERDESNQTGVQKISDPDVKHKEKQNLKKLPSAQDCLKNQSSPAFLRLGRQKEVDWDKNLKSLDHSEDDKPVDFKTNAVPPPVSYEPVTDPGIKVVDSDGNKRKRIEDELEDQMTSTKAYKVHKDDDEDR
ncbi:upf0690 protein c1orf52 homolog [Plakobranchus ocellatus]|uniref:Upf0690 protein c1orf52 homolog n=1 Tax=Plakobranchus ocellatus TaxID=259542 RepID=A0AAV3XUW2_9GAST|nr:upf0690 protein c1orf52 homolog [Plakobranchus ocellatus]